MASYFDRGRRRFCGACASAAVFLGGLPRLVESAAATTLHYPHAPLIGEDSSPITTADLETGVNYIFCYPYRSTPCFLLKLEEPITAPVTLKTREKRAYTWNGGVGPERNVVAFSAICSHRMTHPAPEVSFISYHRGGRHTGDEGGVIHCCSEGSVFDPSAGAKVLNGPAPEPLAAVNLEHDPADDTLTATGMTGGTLFNRFLTRFGDRLALNYGTTAYRQMVDGECPVVLLSRFSRVRNQC